MSQTASTLSLRNLHDVFGEIDPVRRRAAIDEIFHQDAVFYEPNGAYRGRDEIDRIAGVIKATHPDFQYQPLSPPEEIGDGCRVRWVSGSPGKPPAYAGTDFIRSVRLPSSWRGEKYPAVRYADLIPPAQAQCNPRSVGFRHALNASTQRHQNSDHGGTCSISARRRSASRRQWSRLSIIRLTEAERNSPVLRASCSIARSCSTSTRNTFISMINSFSSRRITGSGSGASHGWGTGNGVAR